MKPGDTVLDLGGHVGTFSLIAAALGCRVACVEPAPRNVALLRASVARNGFDRMRVVAAAVTDREGTLEFLPHGPWGTTSNAAVAQSPALIYASEHAPVTVRAVKVDGLVRKLGWDRVDFLKMDSEGSEVAAIRGMNDLLSRPDGPTIAYESNGHALGFFGATPNQLRASLAAFGYRSFIVRRDRLVPLRPDDFQAASVINCLAIKGPPPGLQNRPVSAQRSPDDVLAETIATSRAPHAHDRACLARALAQPAARSLPRAAVTRILRSLRNDPD